MAYDGNSMKSSNSLDWTSAAIIGGLWALLGLSFFTVLALGLMEVGIYVDLIRVLFVIYSPTLLVCSKIIHQSWRVPIMMALTSIPIMIFFMCLLGIVGGFGLPV